MSLILSEQDRELPEGREPARDVLVSLITALAYVFFTAVLPVLAGCGGGECDAQCAQQQAAAEAAAAAALAEQQRQKIPATPERSHAL